MGGFDAVDEGGAAREPLSILTGKTAKRVSIDPQNKEELIKIFAAATSSKTPLTVTSLPSPDENTSVVIDNNQKLTYKHVYYLKTSSSNTVKLNNPHGKNHLELSWDSFLNYFINYETI